MKITKKTAQKLAKDINLNTDVIDIDTFQYALNVELEHGTRFGKLANVTNDNLDLTSKIVIAHLLEFPDYYKRLQKMEIKAEKYWENKEKPNIFFNFIDL